MPTMTSSFDLAAQITGRCYKVMQEVICLIQKEQLSNISRFLTQVIRRDFFIPVARDDKWTSVAVLAQHRAATGCS